MSKKRARVLPWASSTASKLSTHSAVSWGSVSGSWWENPSKITPPSSRPMEGKGFGLPQPAEVFGDLAAEAAKFVAVGGRKTGQLLLALLGEDDQMAAAVIG